MTATRQPRRRWQPPKEAQALADPRGFCWPEEQQAMTSSLEKRFEGLLVEAGIEFARPERLDTDPTTLDYYLPAFDLYVELKGYHTPRLARQLERVPRRSSVLVLVGPQSVAAFFHFAQRLVMR
jgi:hypothetical protein